MSNFQQELEELINKHSWENGSDTPDFILAEYMCSALAVFNRAVNDREKWYGRLNGKLEDQVDGIDATTDDRANTRRLSPHGK